MYYINTLGGGWFGWCWREILLVVGKMDLAVRYGKMRWEIYADICKFGAVSYNIMQEPAGGNYQQEWSA